MKKITQLLKKSAALVVLLITVSVFLVSCQEDKVIVQNPPPEQSIEPGSDLVILMRNVSENDVSVDNIIDETDCSSIQFPFTVIAGGIEVIIDSIEDLLVIQQIIDDNQGNGNIEILFPITIILPDYTTIVIESQEEFDLFIASCDPSPNECVDFVYPISFSVFNLEFELIETVVIENDFDLFFFLQDLNDNNGNIVSINFPVSLIYDNGTTIEVSTNTDLAAAIAAGSDNCEDMVDPDPDPDNLCPAALVEAYLLECFWFPSSYDGVTDNAYEYYHFTFSENSDLEMTTTNAYNIDALWSVTEVDDKTIVLLEAVFPIFEPFLGDWEVLECSEEQLLLEREDGVQMVFSRDCDYDLAQCTGSGLGICDTDGDGFVTVDFNEILDLHFTCNDALEYAITFHETYEDADNGTNPLASPYQTTVSGSQTFYYSITELSTGLIKYVSSWQIDAEDCGGCNNPGLLIDDLIVYMPFAASITELISNQNLPVNGAFLAEDREGNFCALGLNENSTANPFDTSPENWIEEFDDFSISIWFRMQNTNVGDFEVMFSTGQFETDGFALGVSDLNTPIFLANATGVNLFDSDWNEEVDVVWTNTDWHHLVITHQGNLTQMFRDGILRDETTVDINIGGAIDTGFILNGFVNKFIGNIDDLRVYKKALNPNEIFLLFNDGGDCYTCLD